jgi:hypothetical protein
MPELKPCRTYVQIFSGLDLGLVSELDHPTLGWILSGEYVMRSRQVLTSRIGVAPALIVDPITWRLAPELKWMLAPDGATKPIYDRLIRQYQLGEFGLSPLPATPDKLERYVWAVLAFQARHLDPGRSTDDLELFGDLLPRTIGRATPDSLLAPSIVIRNADDLDQQRTLWDATPDRFEQFPVDRVLCIDPRFLVDPGVVNRVIAMVRPGVRIWLWVPRFRDLLRTRPGLEIAAAIRPAVGRLLARGPVGILNAGHHLSLLILDGVDALAFALHLEGGAEAKASSGPAVPYSYVTAAHGLASFDDVSAIVRHFDSPAELQHWFCPEATCVERFIEVGARQFAREMFERMPTRTGEQATPAARLRQRRHGLRARLWELDRISQLPREALLVQLRKEAERTPFVRAGRDLTCWLDAYARQPTRASR